jgi:hypothetical protein
VEVRGHNQPKDSHGQIDFSQFCELVLIVGLSKELEVPTPADTAHPFRSHKIENKLNKSTRRVKIERHSSRIISNRSFKSRNIFR